MSTLQDTRVGRYRIESVAGRGGMGVVYRARDDELDRVVALKVIAPELARDEGFRVRFERESRMTAALDHPNVIPVFNAGEDDGRLFIAMRLVDGTDLGRMLQERGALEPALAAELVAQAASALDAAHTRGLVHRDVKPANLLIAGDRRPHVYLTDFGLAKRDGSAALTSTGNWLGTPDYSSPEQIEGRDLDPRSDVYALGCVLFAALTGRPPFADVPRLRKGGAQVHEAPPALRDVRPEVPPAFEPVVARALAKDPMDRYGSAGALADDALAAAGGAPEPATAPTRRSRRRPRSTTLAGSPTRRLATAATARLRGRRPARGRLLAVVAALALAVVATVAALGALSSDTANAPTPPRAVRHAPAAPAPKAPDPAAGTVRCGATSCAQGVTRVQPPIESGRCTVAGRGGSWVRIDAGSPPLLACQPSAAPAGARTAPVTMPDLVGARLDHAQTLLGRLGVGTDSSGGGILGVIDNSNWQVCATRPPAHGLVAPGAKAKLFVDRGC